MKRTTTAPLVRRRLPRTPRVGTITKRAYMRSMAESYERGFADGVRFSILVMLAVVATLASGFIG
jgi:hypothetical protein